ncbi:MAG: glycine--tRNA ligase subunit beta [Nitrospinae bacterium]|nr:glycine--tRNA ligase subunit beta [Nitrospinota bacterium]
MPDLFIEIGTEEIPAGYIQPALEDMGRRLAEFFDRGRVAAGTPQLMGTPRRLVVHIPDIDARQKDVVETYQGPNVKVAFDENGNPTKAAIGFAKGKGVDIADLTTETTPKCEVICAQVEKKGQPTALILNEYLPQWIAYITFPKKMRWASRKLPFARPIHWISALFDGKRLKFEFEGIQAGNTSRGHRFLKPDKFKFDSLKTYLRECKKHKVMVDPAERRQSIKDQIKTLAKQVKGKVKEDAGLLDTVTYLVEYPVAVLGKFDKAYLELPKELLVITMKHHQKYFPVWKGDKLLPYFITISNMKARGQDIARGNQRVLKARLEDARFFYNEDRKRRLEDFVDDLKGVVFQKDLGTSHEKLMRIVSLASAFAQKVCPEEETTAKRAALLSKADLVTQMVFEFPELQGIMGGYYAEHSGESAEVAQAIKEHYQPAFAGDAVPSTEAGAVVAVADKLDTLVGCIGVGLIPSGSEDPYALRRHALGIIQILIHYDWPLRLDDLIDTGIQTLGAKAKLSRDDIRRHCGELFGQRLKTMLTGDGYPYDAIDAVLSAGIGEFKEVRAKVAALSDLKKQPYFEDLATAFKRVVRIIEGDVPETIDQELLKEEAEQALFRKFAGIKSTVENHTRAGDYSAALAKIVELKGAVDNFFDRVMVNVEDEALKQNRMALLQSIANLFAPLADFSKIVLKKTEKS